MGSVMDSGQQPPSRRHSALLTRLPRTTGASRNQAAPPPHPAPALGPAPAPSFQQRGARWDREPQDACADPACWNRVGQG